MLLCAYIWTLFAIGSWRDVVTYTPGAFHLLIPGHARAIMWGVSAVIAIALAWSPRRSWFGLMLLVVMPTYTMTSYLWAWIITLFGFPGSPRGWYLASFYFALVGLVAVSAFIPSPLDRETSALRRAKTESG